MENKTSFEELLSKIATLEEQILENTGMRKFGQWLVAVSCTVAASGIIGILMFLWGIQGDFPRVKSQLEEVRSSVSKVQSDVNDVKLNQQIFNSEQKNMKDQIDDLKENNQN